MGEKQGPEFNYLLFLDAALDDYDGGKRAFSCEQQCYLSPKEKKGCLKQVLRDRDWAVRGEGDNTGTIHFWRSLDSKECCHCPPSAHADALWHLSV